MLNQEEIEVWATPSYDGPRIGANQSANLSDPQTRFRVEHSNSLAFLESPEKWWSYSLVLFSFSDEEIPNFKWKLGLLDDGHTLKINLCTNVVGGTSRPGLSGRGHFELFPPKVSLPRSHCARQLIGLRSFPSFPVNKQQILDSGSLQEMDKSLCALFTPDGCPWQRWIRR